MPDKKVLLVDDEQDILTMIGQRVKSWGYDLVTALDSKTAIDALTDEKPDMIILDYMLPDMDGVATLKEIRKINKDIPVIMFTAFPDKRSLEGTAKLGITAYIPKLSVHSDASKSLRTALEIAAKEKKE